jgi:hypothetical protein
LASVAGTAQETVAAIERLLGEGPASRAARSAAMAAETWRAKVESILQAMEGP